MFTKRKDELLNYSMCINKTNRKKYKRLDFYYFMRNAIA